MNTSCGDTVKCRLHAGKSPIFRSQSPCVYIYVQESQRFWNFVRNITYCSRKGLRISPSSERLQNQMWSHHFDVISLSIMSGHNNKCDINATGFVSDACRVCDAFRLQVVQPLTRRP